MGWFLINILLPVCVPLAFLLAARLVDLPEPYASRTKLLKVVQDGQLGWVAIVFAAASAYDLFARMQNEPPAPVWAGQVFTISCVFLATSGLLAMLGTLYPVDESLPPVSGWWPWIVRYRLFLGTAFATMITASLLSLVHYELPARCDPSPTGVKSDAGGRT